MDKQTECCRCGCPEKMHNRIMCDKIQHLQAELDRLKEVFDKVVGHYRYIRFNDTADFIERTLKEAQSLKPERKEK